jgi:UDP-2,3-diacylglucosamine hydrolase
MRETVYFTSDHHFGDGADQPARIQRFVRWIDGLDDAKAIYLLGDVFDFWLDYPNFMPTEHMEVLYGLSRARDRGIELVFVGGNHDIWCEQFFEGTLGVPSLQSGELVELQGLRFRLHHGDGLLSGDRAYKIFRAVVRNPATIFLARAVHPELVQALADWLSRTSRKRYHGTDEELHARIEQYIALNPQTDCDHFVCGHIHYPVSIASTGWTFTCLGDWVKHFTAARLRDGEFTLIQVDESGQSRPL